MKQRVIRWRGMNKPSLGFEPVDLERIRRTLGFDGRGGGFFWGKKKKSPKGKTK